MKKSSEISAAKLASNEKIILTIFLKSLFFLLAVVFPCLARAVENPQSNSITMSAIVHSSSGAVVMLEYLNRSDLSDAILIFRGYAYPQAVITLKKGEEIVETKKAETDGSFEISLPEIPIGNYYFTLQSEEISRNDLSDILKFNIKIDWGSNIVIEGIFFPPTLHLEKSEVAIGGKIKFEGRTAPGAKVTLLIDPIQEFHDILADASGNWSFYYDTSGEIPRYYQAKAKVFLRNKFSMYSRSIGFNIGENNVKGEEIKKIPNEIEIPLYPKNSATEQGRDQSDFLSMKNQTKSDSKGLCYLIIAFLIILIIIIRYIFKSYASHLKR